MGIVQSKLSTDVLQGLQREIPNIEAVIAQTSRLPSEVDDHVAARFMQYNLLDSPAIRELVTPIAQQYAEDFLGGTEFNAMCWANVMKRGERIRLHNHWNFSKIDAVAICMYLECPTGASPLDIVTGTLHEVVSITPSMGDVVVFPNNLSHRVKRLKSERRISLLLEVFPRQLTLGKEECRDL